MGNNNEGKVLSIGAEAGRIGYEASVVSRMTGRAGTGSSKGVSGIALEIMATDKSNMENLFKPDTITKLTKSSTAPQVDAVTTTAGKVVERIQFKDTVSPSGVRKTLEQVKSGKYQQVQLRGTIEATEKYNAAAEASGITKAMKSTGISHDTTQRVGDKFINRPIKPASMTDAIKGSATTSVAITTATEVGKSIMNGESMGECTSHVVSKGAESALTTVVTTAVAETTTGLAATLLASSAIPVLGPAVVGIGTALCIGNAMGEITDGVFDDVGTAIGNTVDNITYGISNAVESFADGVSNFVGNLFSWI